MTSNDIPKKRQRKPRQPREPQRLSEQTIDGMDGIFTGFGAWYRANYDEQGRYVGVPIPGLTPPPEEP